MNEESGDRHPGDGWDPGEFRGFDIYGEVAAEKAQVALERWAESVGCKKTVSPPVTATTEWRVPSGHSEMRLRWRRVDESGVALEVEVLGETTSFPDASSLAVHLREFLSFAGVEAASGAPASIRVEDRVALNIGDVAGSVFNELGYVRVQECAFQEAYFHDYEAVDRANGIDGERGRWRLLYVFDNGGEAVVSLSKEGAEFAGAEEYDLLRKIAERTTLSGGK